MSYYWCKNPMALPIILVLFLSAISTLAILNDPLQSNIVQTAPSGANSLTFPNTPSIISIDLPSISPPSTSTSPPFKPKKVNTSLFQLNSLTSTILSYSTPNWICNSNQNPKLFTPENCSQPAGCSLRQVYCGSYEGTTQTWSQMTSTSECVDLSATIGTAPVKVRSDCPQSVVCAALNCATNHGECTFDATNVQQPWFCQCKRGFSGDRCNVCGESAVTPPLPHLDCSSRGFKTEFTQLVESISPSPGWMLEEAFCGCRCQQLRANTTSPVPLFGGSAGDCGCDNSFIGAIFNTTTWSEYLLGQDGVSPTPNPYTTIQSLVKLLIADMDIDLGSVLVYKPDGTIGTLQGQNAASLDNQTLALFPSSRLLIDPGGILQVFFGVEYCNNQPFKMMEAMIDFEESKVASQNQTTTQRPSRFTSINTQFGATNNKNSHSGAKRTVPLIHRHTTLFSISQATPATIEAKLASYQSNPNAIIYDSNIFQYVPPLSFYHYNSVTDPGNDDVTTPFYDLGPQTLPKTRKNTWVLSKANWISGITLCISLTVLYIIGHCQVLSKYNQIYEPARKAAELTYFTSTYRSLFLTFKYQCSSTDPYTDTLDDYIRGSVRVDGSGDLSGVAKGRVESIMKSDIQPIETQIDQQIDQQIVEVFIKNHVDAIDKHPNPSYPQRAKRHNPYVNKTTHGGGNRKRMAQDGCTSEDELNTTDLEDQHHSERSTTNGFPGTRPAPQSQYSPIGINDRIETSVLSRFADREYRKQRKMKANFEKNRTNHDPMVRYQHPHYKYQNENYVYDNETDGSGSDTSSQGQRLPRQNRGRAAGRQTPRKMVPHPAPHGSNSNPITSGFHGGTGIEMHSYYRDGGYTEGEYSKRPKNSSQQTRPNNNPAFSNVGVTNPTTRTLHQNIPSHQGNIYHQSQQSSLAMLSSPQRSNQKHLDHYHGNIRLPQTDHDDSNATIERSDIHYSHANLLKVSPHPQKQPADYLSSPPQPPTTTTTTTPPQQQTPPTSQSLPRAHFALMALQSNSFISPPLDSAPSQRARPTENSNTTSLAVIQEQGISHLDSTRCTLAQKHPHQQHQQQQHRPNHNQSPSQGSLTNHHINTKPTGQSYNPRQNYGPHSMFTHNSTGRSNTTHNDTINKNLFRLANNNTRSNSPPISSEQYFSMFQQHSLHTEFPHQQEQLNELARGTSSNTGSGGSAHLNPKVLTGAGFLPSPKAAAGSPFKASYGTTSLPQQQQQQINRASRGDKQ